MLPEIPVSAQTLFTESPGKTAILVMNKKETVHKSRCQFENGHAALDWCAANKTILI